MKSAIEKEEEPEKREVVHLIEELAVIGDCIMIITYIEKFDHTVTTLGERIVSNIKGKWVPQLLSYGEKNSRCWVLISDLTHYTKVDKNLKEGVLSNGDYTIVCLVTTDGLRYATTQPTLMQTHEIKELLEFLSATNTLTLPFDLMTVN